MAELVVNKKSIYELLDFSKIQAKKFIIPDYQRPYAWEKEKCETLWNDIVDNAIDEETEYFLGTIVTYKDGSDISIIDGQQRLTSFFLLLRAFYHKFENIGDKSKVVKLYNEIGSCIWDTDKRSGSVTDKTKFHIQSLVATEDEKNVFSAILETGEVNEGAKDNYSANYRFFKDKCEETYASGAKEWEDLCLFFLHNCIILPIECDKQETALTIFDTLNNRGLPLADSDIFKAKIYKTYKSEDDKKAFANNWKEMTETCKSAGITIDDIFRCYMHIKRARKNDSSKEVGMRRFYDTNKNYLEEPDLVEEIKKLTSFWLYVNIQKLYPDVKEDGYSFSLETKKWVHCLSCYPNDYWKFPVSVFFLKHKDDANFDDKLSILLRKLITMLFSKFILQPTVNAIRDDIFKYYIAIENESIFDIRSSFNKAELQRRFTDETFGAPRIERALLLLDAYITPGQTDLITSDFHIEHILPQNWKKNYYDEWETQEAAKPYIEKLGNKVALEFKVNISAGDKYFAKKKEIYQTKELSKKELPGSKIEAVRNLIKLHQDDWGKADIIKRHNEFIDRIMAFFEDQL
jgi:uncharacterized protein with ParB-like and HNH nuclease domain